jgi:hypothetical protein
MEDHSACVDDPSQPWRNRRPQVRAHGLRPFGIAQLPSASLSSNLLAERLHDERVPEVFD